MSLYKTFVSDAKPRVGTVLKVLRSLGVTLTVTAQRSRSTDLAN